MLESFSILVTRSLPLAQNAWDRLHAGSKAVRGNDVSAWWWSVPILLGAVGGVLLVGVLYSRHHARERAQAEEFSSHARRLGLGVEEMAILRHIANLAGLKSPGMIFTMDAAFDMGVSALLKSQQLTEAPRQQRLDTCAVLAGLREKLGFSHTPENDLSARSTSHHIEPTSRLDLACAGQANAACTVLENTADGLVVDKPPSLSCKEGMPLAARYFDGQTLWEFQSSVVRVDTDSLLLAHNAELRFVDRRRYPRVPVRRSAMVAAFPFAAQTNALQAPVFVEATLTEIAGPGLRLNTQVTARAGQRMLVVLKLQDGRVVQAAGKTRRIAGPTLPEQADVAVELVGLTASEAAELAHETNLALLQDQSQRQKLRRAASEA